MNTNRLSSFFFLVLTSFAGTAVYASESPTGAYMRLPNFVGTSLPRESYSILIPVHRGTLRTRNSAKSVAYQNEHMKQKSRFLTQEQYEEIERLRETLASQREKTIAALSVLKSTKSPNALAAKRVMVEHRAYELHLKAVQAAEKLLKEFAAPAPALQSPASPALKRFAASW